jgi:hypothetical protein
MSSDGKYQTAARYPGYIFTSSDYGNTWIQRFNSANWQGLAMSSDGKYQTASVLNGYIYISSDYGVNWAQKDSTRSWYAATMSSDGHYQVATASTGIWVSTDYGANWTGKGSSQAWYGIAMSSDAKYITGVVYNGYIYTSQTSSYMYGGNLGIGTTSPADMLTIAGNSGNINIGKNFANYNGIWLNGDTSSGNYNFLSSAAEKNLYINRPSGQSIQFRENNADQMTILSGGNVGIGTTAPTAKLHVFDPTANREPSLTYSATATATINNALVELAMGTTASSPFPFWMQARSSTNAAWPIAINPLGGNVGIGTTNPTQTFQINNNFAVSSSGSVGVGMTSPGYPLDVNGIVRTTSSTSPSAVALYNTFNNANNRNWAVMASNIAWGDFVISQSNVKDGSPINSGTPRLHIGLTGNVGIGQTNANEKLEVNGRIRMATWTADGDTVVYKDDPTGNLGVQASDIRLKKNITQIGSALDIIQGIRGVTFNWKDDPKGKKPIVGVIAQDVAAVMPELTFNITDPDGNNYLGVHYDKLSPLLIEAVKEQQGMIETISNDQFSISSEFSKLNDQAVTMDDKLKIISNSLSALNSRTTASETEVTTLKSNLAAAETRLTAAENNLAVFETSTNDTIAAMLDTENMLTEKVLSHEDRIKALEDKMATATISPSGEIPSNVVTQSADGNVKLAGIFKAKEVQVEKVEADGVVAGKYSVKNESEAPTTGDGVIVSVKTDADSDGWDDETKVDGKSVRITTKAISKDSKIFVTFEGDPGSRYWVEKITDLETGELTNNFSVNLSEAAKKDVKFSWWIVESKN